MNQNLWAHMYVCVCVCTYAYIYIDTHTFKNFGEGMSWVKYISFLINILKVTAILTYQSSEFCTELRIMDFVIFIASFLLYLDIIFENILAWD